MKVKDGERHLRWDGVNSNAPAPLTDQEDLFLIGLSKSISVGTRKMVNYACIG